MQPTLIDQIAEAVLYEGYLLYPYRPSVKNTQRWTFGGLYPPAYCAGATGNEAAAMQMQCLVESGQAATLEITLKFLQLVNRQIGRLERPLTSPGDLSNASFALVDRLAIGGKELHAWQEAVERQVALDRLALHELVATPHRSRFHFAAETQLEPIHDEQRRIAAVMVRQRLALSGAVEVAAETVAPGCHRLTVRAVNQTACEPAAIASRDQAMWCSFASAHLALAGEGCEFVSQIDPPQLWQAAVAQNENVGAWPVLVGEPPRRDLMLAAPIILYDYPQIAPQSPGTLYDSTEIDEILTLRIMTLSDDEKRAMEALDMRGRDLLHRVESLSPDALLQLHGEM